MIFPMSLGGSPVDLDEQTAGLELRRMGSREALEGVSIESGFGKMENDADDERDEETRRPMWRAF
jgi:hypothetical protein